ncbi:hypothetical protein E4T56_gene16129 [Termitomyces sp. T112]|nr:hypothetical protein E4T56_gene16129 [Termitomyces sp. T112]
MDYIVELPNSEGFNVILVVVCHLTKQALFIPCHTTDNAPEFAKLFLKHIFSKHGLPDDIVSNCRPLLSTAYRLETNGQTEQVNQMLEQVQKAPTPPPPLTPPPLSSPLDPPPAALLLLPELQDALRAAPPHPLPPPTMLQSPPMSRQQMLHLHDPLPQLRREIPRHPRQPIVDGPQHRQCSVKEDVVLPGPVCRIKYQLVVNGR